VNDQQFPIYAVSDSQMVPESACHVPYTGFVGKFTKCNLQQVISDDIMMPLECISSEISIKRGHRRLAKAGVFNFMTNAVVCIPMEAAGQKRTRQTTDDLEPNHLTRPQRPGHVIRGGRSCSTGPDRMEEETVCLMRHSAQEDISISISKHTIEP